MITQRRLFAIAGTPHADYRVLDIDEEYVSFKRFLFGLQREEIRKGHTMLQAAHPGYLDLPFEDWATFNSNATLQDSIPTSGDDPDVRRLRERFRQRLSAQPADFFHEIHAQIAACTEITDSALFLPALVVATRDDSGEWLVQRFSPACRNIIDIRFDSENLTPETADRHYAEFEKRFPERLPEVWPLLRERMEDQDIDADALPAGVFPESLSDENLEKHVRFTEVFLHAAGAAITALGSWDQRFELHFSKDGQVELG